MKTFDLYIILQVYDGESESATQLVELCGTPNVNGLAYGSTENYMAIKFHSDYSIASAGFRASYISYGKILFFQFHSKWPKILLI